MEKELMELGLSLYEARALKVLMENKVNLRQLSDKSRIPFGKTYSIVKSLKEKNLVKETNSRPKLVYVENSSETISKLIREKEIRENQFLERLRDFATEMDKRNKKVTKFFEIGTTAEDNKRIQLRSFDEAEKEVLQIINIHHKPKSNRGSKTIWEKKIAEAVSVGVSFKSIYPVKTELPKILLELNKKYPKEFQIKRIDTDFVRCDIIDSKNVMIKMVQQDPLQFGGIIFVENNKLAENLKGIFYELWEQAD